MPDRSHPADGVRRYRPAGDAVGYAVRTEHVRITMDDGARLAATLYVPDGPGPFPTVLESIPYRKDDWTFSRDWPLHGAFAAAVYVSCRLAGPGDPGGLADRAATGWPGPHRSSASPAEAIVFRNARASCSRPTRATG